jgi:putative SOS response-associated peptidase YedK
MINARAETLIEKPSYRKSFERRRCLVPADGFYEWQKVDGTKVKIPMRFVLKDRRPFAFAGLWDSWRKPDGGELQSFTIITTAANEVFKPIHDRMPVILHRKDYARWLDPVLNDTAKLTTLLAPYVAAEMETYEVSSVINSPRNDVSECIAPRSQLKLDSSR